VSMAMVAMRLGREATIATLGSPGMVIKPSRETTGLRAGPGSGTARETPRRAAETARPSPWWVAPARRPTHSRERGQRHARATR
jgi:hypothetical protein